MALPQGVFQQQLQALASQGLTLQPTGICHVIKKYIQIQFHFHSNFSKQGDV
jgi:hypothetical protein